MGYEHEGPGRVNVSDQVYGGAAVRWEDAAEVERWFEAIREAVKDLRGAGRDRARSRRKRVLSRAEAGRQIGESSKRALSLLGAGEAGWRGRPSPSDGGPEPDAGPAGGSREESPPVSSSRPTPSDRAG